MSDHYGGHAEAFQLQNQLGQQAQDMNELRLNGWKTQSLAFKNLDHNEQQKQDTDIKNDVESDVTKIDQVYSVGRAGFRAAKGAGTVLKYGGTVRQAASVAGKALGEVGEGSKLFGEGATAAKDITGAEGVIAGALLKGGGETFAKVGAKAFGAVGAGIAAYEDFDNLSETGSLLKTKDAAGNIVDQNIGVTIGNAATLLGGALDIGVALTGGALAPVAAAVNIFAAVDSAIAGVEQDKEEKAEDEKEKPGTTAPPPVAPAAFAQFGLLANQSHDPLARIN